MIHKATSRLPYNVRNLFKRSIHLSTFQVHLYDQLYEKGYEVPIHLINLLAPINAFSINFILMTTYY